MEQSDIVIQRISTRIVKAREAAGLSQPELARRAGLAKQTMWLLENGKNPNPGVRTLTTVASVLDLPLGVLLGEDETAFRDWLQGVINRRFGL